MFISAPICILLIYALLLGGGGFMGYRKAGSRASLIAGSSTAAVAVAAAAIALVQPRLGQSLGITLAICLTALFGYRYLVKTKKFMPSGLLAVLSLGVALALWGLAASAGV